jgi:hypothetical protein
MGKKQKISRFAWEDLTGQEELQDLDMEQFRLNLHWVLASPQLAQDAYKFLLADSFSNEMSIEAQAAVYRLSEQIPKEYRGIISVYETLTTDGFCDLSLEEWRERFEAEFRDPLSIPLFLGERPRI